MDVLQLVPTLYSKVTVFVLAFSRISALFSTFSVFHKRYVNPRIVISFSFILAFYAITLTPQRLDVALFSLPMFIQIGFQVLIGFMGGMILNTILEIYIAVGQIVSTKVGYAMITLFDPRLGAITPLTLLYFYVGVLTFFMLNGHLIVVKCLLDSFSVLPIGVGLFKKQVMVDLMKYTNVIFMAGVLLSMTIIICVLIINLTMAIMTKFAPQFNIFSVGINFTIIFGLIIIYMTFSLFVDQAGVYMQQGFEFLRHLFLGMQRHV